MFWDLEGFKTNTYVLFNHISYISNFIVAHIQIRSYVHRYKNYETVETHLYDYAALEPH